MCRSQLAQEQMSSKRLLSRLPREKFQLLKTGSGKSILVCLHFSLSSLPSSLPPSLCPCPGCMRARWGLRLGNNQLHSVSRQGQRKDKSTRMDTPMKAPLRPHCRPAANYTKIFTLFPKPRPPRIAQALLLLRYSLSVTRAALGRRDPHCHGSSHRHPLSAL